MEAVPPEVRPGRWLGLLAASIAAAAALFAFAPALEAGFVDLDDGDLFVRNPFFRGLDAEHLRWMFTNTLMGHYAPLTWLSAAIDFTLFGLDPRAFHRTNLILHAANAACFYFVAARLLAASAPERAEPRSSMLRLAALASALLFAVHPLRAESVVWVTERRGLLATTFLLLAGLAWLRAVEAGSPRLASRRFYALAIGAFALSLLAKGLGMTFVVVAVLLDVFPLRRLPPDPRRWLSRSLRPVWVQKIPLLALGAASAIVSSAAARSAPDTVRSLDEWGLLARLAQTGYGLLFYVRKTLWPADLAAVYELPQRFDPTEPRFLVGLAVALAFVPGVAWLYRRRPGLATSLAVYAVALSPVLGLAQAGPQLVADRYSYVACMPIALLAGAWILRTGPRIGRLGSIALGATVLAIVVGCSLASRRQSVVWHDSESLWRHALDAGEPSSIAYSNLGALEGRAGRLDSAAEHLQASLAIRADQGRAWFNLGVVRELQGDWPSAEQALTEASRSMQPAWDPLCRLGDLYLRRMNRPGDAVRAFRAAIEDVEGGTHRSFSPVPYLGLGIALARQGKRDVARALLEFASGHAETREEALRELARL